jgi:hypothetical protein
VVTPVGRPPLRVHREEVHLRGEGLIVLGGESSDPGRTLRYRTFG